MDIKKLLNDYKNNIISEDQAVRELQKAPFTDIDFAKLDLHRSIRSGFGEVVFCQGKEDDFLVKIFNKLYAENGEVLGTRASQHQYDIIKASIPEAEYNKIGRTIRISKKRNIKNSKNEEQAQKEKHGKIVVATAGTADIPVAEEAYDTCDFFGANPVKLYDVGIAGLHRILSAIDILQSANCIIAIAGMEGALPTVISGLVGVPVIAVPTSIGYGASFGGISALLTMINSCANGVSVVNIDNGYGAGYIASQIARMCK